MLNFQSSLAEAEERAKIAVESNAQLKNENSILVDQINILQNSVGKLEEQCHQIQKMHTNLLKVREKSQDILDEKTLRGLANLMT